MRLAMIVLLHDALCLQRGHLLHRGWLGQRQTHLQQICTAAYAWQATVDNSRVSVFTLSGCRVCGGAVDVVRGQRALERAGLLSLDRLQRFWHGAQRGCAGTHRAVTQNRALDRRPRHTGARLRYRGTQMVYGDNLVFQCMICLENPPFILVD